MITAAEVLAEAVLLKPVEQAQLVNSLLIILDKKMRK